MTSFRAETSYGKEKYPEIKDKLISFDGKTIPFNDDEFDVITMFTYI